MSPTITAVAQILGALDRVPFIVSVLTKGTLIVLIAVGLTRLLARAPAAARHLVWSLSVAGLLLLPATSLIPWRLELSTLAAARDAFSRTSRDVPPVDTRATPSPVSSTSDVVALNSSEPERAVSTESPVPSPESPRLIDPSSILI